MYELMNVLMNDGLFKFISSPWNHIIKSIGVLFQRSLVFRFIRSWQSANDVGNYSTSRGVRTLVCSSQSIMIVIFVAYRIPHSEEINFFPALALPVRAMCWCDVMWCDVMRCYAMWCDVMWCDMMWCDVMRTIWCDVTKCDMM